MSDQDIIDLYSKRREEYVAMRDRMRDLKSDLKNHLDNGRMEEYRAIRFDGDILARDLHRVQDSMRYLESRVCQIFPDHKPNS